MTYTKDIVATLGEYKAKDGEIKKRYQKCGAMFESDDGRQSFKFDVWPVHPEFTGWFSLYEPRDRTAPVNKPSAPAQDDDVPF